MADPSIYDQLAKEALSELTVTQLNAGSSVTSVDQATIAYWKGPITLARILESSRTYAHGLPVPESGDVEVLSVDDASVGTIKPTGTEVWLVQGLSSDETVGFALFDGTNTVPLDSSTGYIPTSPLYLTPTLYLSVSNGSGSAASVKLAYHKVSL